MKLWTNILSVFMGLCFLGFNPGTSADVQAQTEIGQGPEDRSVPVPELKKIRKYIDEIRQVSSKLDTLKEENQTHFQKLKAAYDAENLKGVGITNPLEKERHEAKMENIRSQVLKGINDRYTHILNATGHILNRMDMVVALVDQVGTREAGVVRAHRETEETIVEISGLMQGFNQRLLNIVAIYEATGGDPAVESIFRSDGARLYQLREQTNRELDSLNRLMAYQRKSRVDTKEIGDYVHHLRERIIDIRPLIQIKRKIATLVAMTRFGIVTVRQQNDEIQKLPQELAGFEHSLFEDPFDNILQEMFLPEDDGNVMLPVLGRASGPEAILPVSASDLAQKIHSTTNTDKR